MKIFTMGYDKLEHFFSPVICMKLSANCFHYYFLIIIWMKNFVRRLGDILEHYFLSSRTKFACLVSSLLHVLTTRVEPFWIQLGYLITLSLVGYVALKLAKPKTAPFSLKNIDLFFMSMSAITVSSMSTVEMEAFSSNLQLFIIIILMLVGGEVFTSILGIQFTRLKLVRPSKSIRSSTLAEQIELGLIAFSHIKGTKVVAENEETVTPREDDLLKYNSIKYLGLVVLGYFLVVHAIGFTLIYAYVSLDPHTVAVLKIKGLQKHTFSAFATISTFANCGFMPMNENMAIFKKNSGLLLLLIPLVLLGNSMYTPSLQFVIWALERTTRQAEFSYMLRNAGEMGYSHLLLTGLGSSFQAFTVLKFILVQLVLFCSMEWNSEAAMEGLSSNYEKTVASLFQVVNTRHAGESVFDMSTISAAVLVLFVLMMYLPGGTSFLPIKDEQRKASLNNSDNNKVQKKVLEYLTLSQLSYLVMFVILICITERRKLQEDPLNFNVMNIIFEVISAYGNVGLSIGYSCKQQLKPEGYCKDLLCGFAGRWSNKGKLVLIFVMLIGRIKKFNMKGGRAWKLS